RDLAVSRLVVTLEEGTLRGGFGQYISSQLKDKSILNLGIPDDFVTHGSTREILDDLKLDPAGVSESVKEHVRVNSEIC
ncbi:MAG: hypothetical protein KAS73_13455, partial [Candidatus Sabulitectum sp.]|nr:hypothetical protein [Candidatus Sabulitectum sp.]